MKTVCMLLHNPYDVDVRVRRKAEALVAAGYLVDVLALRGSGNRNAYTLNGVNVYTVALGKRRGTMARYAFEYCAFFLWACLRLSRLMAKRHYAIIDVNTLPDFLVFAAVVARWMGAKVLLDMHEISPEFYISKYGVAESSLMVRILKHLEKLSFDFADHVITIHEPIQDLLASRGLSPAKSTVVMNAVDEASFGSRSRSLAAGGELASGRFLMMYHGTLTRIYGLDIAIEAFDIAHSEMPGSELWILGDGPEKCSLERLIRARGLTSKVRLIGAVPPTEVAPWVNKCDIGILPMRRDVFLDLSFPNKLSEYIVLGKSVVVPRLKTIRHYFSEEALAYFEANEPSDLARQMVHVYRDRELRSRLAARAKAEYEPICWDVMRRRYLTLMEEIIGTRGQTAELSCASKATRLPG